MYYYDSCLIVLSSLDWVSAEEAGSLQLLGEKKEYLTGLWEDREVAGDNKQ